MANWILVPCLVALRGEFNKLSPNRDKGADGSIGDAAHQQESSDHNPDETGRTPFEDADSINEVHAIDIDSTGPWPAGKDLNSRVEIIRLNHLRGRDNRLQNIIWKDRVASRSWDWTWQDRPGIGHFDHAHFSARYTTAQENDTSPWGVWEDDDMPLTPADLDAVEERAKAGFIAAIGDGNFAALNPTTSTKAQTFVRDALRHIVGGPVDQGAILTAIAGTPAAVLAQIGNPDTPDEQVAAALVSLLGERKAAVLALMQ